MMGRRTQGLVALGSLLAFATLSIVLAVAVFEAGLNLDPGSTILLVGGLWFHFVLGVVIVRRADGHRVGWLFAVSATMFATVFGCWAAASALGSTLDAAEVRGWLVLTGALLFAPATILFVPAVAMVFPTGSLPGPRWRWVAWLITGLVVVSSIATVVLPVPLDGDVAKPFSSSLVWLPPAAVAVVRSAIDLGTVAIVIAMASGVLAIAVRFARADGLERQQIKWVLAAVVPAAILIPVSLRDDASDLVALLSTATLPLIAASVTVAVLRYRLFEIDRIISRTVSWAIVTVVFVAMFAVLVVGLQAAMAGITQGETLAVAASTLITVALFQPVRRRVQAVVDQRFDRARYDGARTATAFADRLRNQVNVGELEAEIEKTISVALRPSAVGVWVRSPAVAAE
jgi:hypothetical protein